MNELIQTLSIYALPVLLAITLHEAAHGYVALRFGDNTAQQAGRITLNPFKHIDPVGTVIVPLLIVMSSAALGGSMFLFGWAKPVPVDFGRLSSPKRDMRYVAVAGPAANFLMAIGWAGLLKTFALTGFSEPFFLEMAQAGIVVNLALGALNLLPILPLDGGRILFSYLLPPAAYTYGKTEPYGFFILLLLLFLNVLPILLRPILVVGYGAISTLFNF